MRKMNLSAKCTAMILTAAMSLGMLAGCGVQPAAPAEAPAETAAASAETVEETAEVVEEVAEEAAEAVEEAAAEEVPAVDDITEIEVYLCDISGVGDNAKAIEEQMNAITEKSIGVHANFTWVPMGEYGTQIGLALANGTPVDLMTNIPISPVNLPSLYANGQLTDMTEYLEEYGSDLLDMTGEYAEAYRVDGGIYGVPTWRNYGSSVYFIMRRDVLDDLGLTEKAEAMTTWAEAEEIFAEVAEKTSLLPIGGAKQIFIAPGAVFPGESFDDAYAFDTLADNLYLVYTDNDGNVSNLMENDDYREMLNRIKKWYDANWIYKDSLITDDHVDVLMKSGVFFADFQVSEIGVETAKAGTTGYEVLCKELLKNKVGSTTVAKFGTVMPVTTQEPEAAVKWLNALYTDPALANLLVWGEEGVDYQIVDGVADYMPGEDAKTVRYHNRDYIYGNYFNALPWQGQGADFRQVSYDNLMTYEPSPYIGFTADLSGMDNTLAAINSVYMKYSADILCGNFDDEKYDSYLAELKTAGSEEYLSSLQEQLSAWQAAK